MSDPALCCVLLVCISLFGELQRNFSSCLNTTVLIVVRHLIEWQMCKCPPLSEIRNTGRSKYAATRSPGHRSRRLQCHSTRDPCSVLGGYRSLSYEAEHSLWGEVLHHPRLEQAHTLSLFSPTKPPHVIIFPVTWASTWVIFAIQSDP